MKDSLVYKLFEMLVSELEGAIASKDLARIREILEISCISEVPILETQTSAEEGDKSLDHLRDRLESLIDKEGDRHEGI